MYRFFEEANNLKDDKIYIFDENYKHIVKVLRIDSKEEFEVVIDGQIYLVKIEEDAQSYLVCQILARRKGDNESPLKINLYQGLPKSDKLELIIQKTIEWGVFSITPFNSERTIVKWDQKKEKKKLKRYEEIAKAASKQAKRDLIARVNPVIDFKKMAEQIKGQPSILAYELRGEDFKKVLVSLGEKSIDEVNVIVGPEGGFSEEEVEILREAGAQVVNLGNRILRTETAAITLTSIIQYELGDL